MTFSIVARLESPGSSPEWGVAVASKFLAVGAAVPWARAGAGALATQALANLAYGPEGLSRLERGEDATSVVRALTEADSEREQRQLGVVDARGGAASYTGRECLPWAGSRPGDGFCCQGNILTGPDVVEAMSEAFEGAAGRLVHRLMRALEAGDEAGGDRRGRQAAAVLVVRERGGYGGMTDTSVDLRVDDHGAPVSELARLTDLHELYFPHEDDLEFVSINEQLAAELRSLLARRGYRVASGDGAYDEELKRALFDYAGTENLEERWSDEALIERKVLDHLRGAPQ